MLIPAAFAESPQASQPHPLVLYSSRASLVLVPTSLQMHGGHADIPGELSPALLLYLQLSDNNSKEDLFSTNFIDKNRENLNTFDTMTLSFTEL